MELSCSAYRDIDFRDTGEHYVDDVWDDIETHRLMISVSLLVSDSLIFENRGLHICSNTRRVT